MRVFVTGGTGFIGSWIVRMLREHGHSVTILARNPAKVRGWVGAEGISFAHGDVSDRSQFATWLAGHDAVIHNALVWGQGAVDMLLMDTLQSVAIFEAAAAAGVKHLIYTSSTAGFGGYLPRMDETVISNPIDPYGATKAASEKYLLAISHMHPAMRCNIVRPGYTFAIPATDGAPDGPDGFRKIVAKAKAGEPIDVREGDGTQFIHAADLVKLYAAILHGTMSRQTYHAVSPDYTTWEWVARRAVEVVGGQSSVVVAQRRGPASPCLFDVSKMQTLVGERFDPHPAIDQYVRWLATRPG